MSQLNAIALDVSAEHEFRPEPPLVRGGDIVHEVG